MFNNKLIKICLYQLNLLHILSRYKFHIPYLHKSLGMVVGNKNISQKEHVVRIIVYMIYDF